MTKAKAKKATALLVRMRDKQGMKFREISAVTGVSVGYLAAILGGWQVPSDKISDKILASKGAKNGKTA